MDSTNSITISINGQTYNHLWGEFVKIERASGIVLYRADGWIEYRNPAGELHREDGPAIMGPGGEKYYVNGEEIKKKTAGRAPKAELSDQDFLKIWLESGKTKNPISGKTLKEGTAKWKECEARAAQIDKK